MNLSPLWLAPAPLVLASGSAARAQLLANTGISFEVIKPQVDERALETPLMAAGATPLDLALALAKAKACQVSAAWPGRLVLGSDQVLDLEGRLLSKPQGQAGAKQHLHWLSGKTHRLHSAAILARDGAVIAQMQDHASLTMRVLDEAFIEAYLMAAGDDVLGSVGAYQIEGLGQHLFADLQGHHATIMGLPLLALLKELRALKMLRG
jgi:septum formation protein